MEAPQSGSERDNFNSSSSSPFSVVSSFWKESEWEGGPNTNYWVYGEEYWKVYERDLDTSSQCIEKS